MKRRFAAWLLALGLLLSMAACAGDGMGDGTDTEAATPTDTTESLTELPGTTAFEGTESPTETAGDGTETDSGTQPTPVAGAPVITLASTQDITVKAGETVTLPAVSVTDADGHDLGLTPELSDNIEPTAVSGDTFCAKVAGKHTLYYFAKTADGRIAEAFLTVQVEAAVPNTFDVQDMDDCDNMKTYKTFRDGFENGRKSPLYAGLGDAGQATHLSAVAGESIEGNSLVIDFAKSAGAAETAVYFNSFNDCFHRNIQATYRVTFFYRLVEADNNFDDIYIGLSWDGSTGINRRFIASDAKVGETYTYTAEFPATMVPEGGQAYFFLFKLNKTDKPVVVSFDNFTVETVEVKQVATVVPTTAELAQGFTWDFVTNGAVCTNGQTEAVDSLPDGIKNALSGHDGFGDHVLHLTGADDHRFGGLTEGNLTPGKVLIIDIDYYAVRDEGFHLIMMGRSGNPTQTVDDFAVGNFHSVHLETTVRNGWYQLNIYGQNNTDFDIYIGRITVRLADARPEEAGKTPGGHTFGMTFSQDARQFGLIDDSTLTLSAYDGYNFGENAGKMGDHPTKFTFRNTSNRVVEWFQTNGRMETGYRYRITVTYYVADFAGAGKLLYCFDRGAFPEFGAGDYMTPGFHEVTTEWVADRDVDYFCFYLDQNTYNGTLYMQGVTVTLLGK